MVAFSTDPSRPPLFREQALRRYVAAREHGDLVRLPPRWTRFAYPLVLAMALAAVVFGWVGRVTQYARGPAIVREAQGAYTVFALLPATDLSALRPGMPLRLEPRGYPRATLRVAIARLSTRPIGPDDARRVVQSAVAEEVTGSVVVASAHLPGSSFRTERGEHRFHDGMLADAETPVGSERIVFALLPGLRALFPE
jgi:hypothetical protein